MAALYRIVRAVICNFLNGKKKKKKSSNEDEGQRMRRDSEDDDDDEEGVQSSVSSWMADHVREFHNGQISTDPLNDFEFACTGVFRKPLHRQVDENLRITRAEILGKIKVGRKVWKVGLPLLNRKHEYWAPRSMTCTFSNFNR